jgi:hypothetical protein
MNMNDMGKISNPHIEDLNLTDAEKNNRIELQTLSQEQLGMDPDISNIDDVRYEDDLINGQLNQDINAMRHAQLISGAAGMSSAKANLTVVHNNLSVANTNIGKGAALFSATPKDQPTTVTEQGEKSESVINIAGASCTSQEHREIAATAKVGKLASNPRQFIDAWGSTINDWASCKNGQFPVCPCCYLCRLPIVSKELYGGQPEMEHVIPCLLAFSNFPNMDILRYYYPFILGPNVGSIDKNDIDITMDNWEIKYLQNTTDRVYSHGFGSSDNLQSLRATTAERNADGQKSMYSFWQEFLVTPAYNQIMKELYLAINCPNDGTDEAGCVTAVKNAFRAYITGTSFSPLYNNVDGAFNRIFEFAFAVILVWLYEHAYSHRICNQRKSDIPLYNSASTVALKHGINDPYTGNKPNHYADDTSDTHIKAERTQLHDKMHENVDEKFNENLVNVHTDDEGNDQLDGHGKTFIRTNKVLARYNTAAELFKRVSIVGFDDDDKGTQQVKEVFNAMNVSRRFKFTNLSDICGISIEGASTNAASGAVSTGTGDIEALRQLKVSNQTDNLKKQIEKIQKAIRNNKAKIQRREKDLGEFTASLKTYTDVQEKSSDKESIQYKRRANSIKSYTMDIQNVKIDIQDARSNITGMVDVLFDKQIELNNLMSPEKQTTPKKITPAGEAKAAANHANYVESAGSAGSFRSILHNIAEDKLPSQTGQKGTSSNNSAKKKRIDGIGERKILDALDEESTEDSEDELAAQDSERSKDNSDANSSDNEFIDDAILSPLVSAEIVAETVRGVRGGPAPPKKAHNQAAKNLPETIIKSKHKPDDTSSNTGQILPPIATFNQSNKVGTNALPSTLSAKSFFPPISNKSKGGTRRKRLPNKSNRTRKGRRARKSKSKSKRTRRARKSKRKPKRTRRVRKSSKSSRKKKTRRRSKK